MQKKLSSTKRLACLTVGIIALAGCGASDPVASQSAPTTKAGATAATTVAAATEVVPGSEVVVSLPAASPTCKAITEVRDLNEKSGASVNEFTAGILPVEGQNRTPAEIEKSFETFLRNFEKDTSVLLPKLSDAYTRLGTSQPQFKVDLVGIEKVTIGLLKTLSAMKGSDLDRFNEIVATALPQADLIAAGEASLKIDKFARAACGVPFANT